MSGIEFSKLHNDLIQTMKDQLIIVLIKRLGGDVKIPVSKVDDTGQDLLTMRLDPETKMFEFGIVKKS